MSRINRPHPKQVEAVYFVSLGSCTVAELAKWEGTTRDTRSNVASWSMRARMRMYWALRHGLVAEDREKFPRRYVITEKGLRWLREHKQREESAA